MKRQITAAVLSAAFIFTSSFSVYAEPKFNYTFEQAAQLAINNSTDLTNADKSVDKASDSYDTAYDAKTKKVNFTVSNFKNFINQQVQPQLGRESAYSTYQQALLQKESTKRNVLLNLREAVIDIEKGEMSVKEAKLQQDLKNIELKALESRYSVGLVSKRDYEAKKLAISKAIDQLDKADKSLGLSYRRLNTLIGREDERDVIVHLDDTVIPVEKLNLDEIKNNLKKNDTNINSLSNQKHVTSVSYALVDERYRRYDYDKLTSDMQDDIDELHEDNQTDYTNAEKTYENAVENFDKSFDDMVEAIEDTYTDIENLKKDIEDEKQNINVYAIKYETGLMSKMEYDTTKINLTLLENDLKSLKLDLNMKYAKLLIWSDLTKVVKE